jgi:hypothetical protein
MKKLSAAIDVAAEYAYHLYRDDGVPKEKAIAAGVAAVVRAAKVNKGSGSGKLHVPHRKAKESGVGFSGQTLMGAGSLLSAAGWLRTLVGG